MGGERCSLGHGWWAMVAGFDFGFVKSGFRIGLGFNYASRFKTGLVGYDLASLSLSLSLTHTHTYTHTHGRSCWWVNWELCLWFDCIDQKLGIYVCGSCIDYSKFVFVILYSCEFVFVIWFLTMCRCVGFFIMDLMVENRWLCNNVCGKKLWNNLEWEMVHGWGWKREIWVIGLGTTHVQVSWLSFPSNIIANLTSRCKV